jgi:hypothetical protein
MYKCTFLYLKLYNVYKCTVLYLTLNDIGRAMTVCFFIDTLPRTKTEIFRPESESRLGDKQFSIESILSNKVYMTLNILNIRSTNYESYPVM